MGNVSLQAYTACCGPNKVSYGSFWRLSWLAEASKTPNQCSLRKITRLREGTLKTKDQKMQDLGSYCRHVACEKLFSNGHQIYFSENNYYFQMI